MIPISRRGTAEVLELSGVGKRYRRGRWVLSDVDMTVPGGASVAVVGANGSGKSTLLRMLAGVTRPSTGRISGVRAPIGYVPDRFPATDAMGSLAYLTHVGRIRGLGTASARRRGRLLLDRLDLAGGVRTPIRALSKGNAQKVALAQALMVPPRLLILDEPWSGLDAAAHGVLAQILGEVVAAGGAVVLTDHRESIARPHVTATYLLEDGRVSLGRPVAVAHVVLTGSRTAHPVAWSRRPGVTGATATPDGVRIEVRPDRCDDLLLVALRAGWSVTRVHRPDGTGP
jgi:ABC-2 type transport system ATP-binding protein